MKIGDYMKCTVFSIPVTATLAEAAAEFILRRVGLLPVVDEQQRVMGVLRLKDLMVLCLPSFVNMVKDIDFVHEFGAVETNHPTPEMLGKPVTAYMQPATTVKEDSGLLRAYALMLQHDLHDLVIVDKEDSKLIGIASRVDISVAVISTWKMD